MSASTSLQIPSVDSPGGSSSRHNYHPNPSAASGNPSRPVSAAVQPSSSSANTSARRQQRASHTVVSSQQQSQQNNHGSGHDNGSHNPNDAPPVGDIYSHPAVQAYVAAHPRRTIPKFGEYLLLQTLGEGEFGKVKLGLHTVWGEEVAVKLIRRVTVDNTLRMSKVGREIEVLRTLKHPNIVRLYDVIETDKYVGIILEYASGGELFDHILAHRYLREKDAAKLFSQLISGVWYIHQKKIVHRDLKLENLLLDKHRNVIITDFGFANRFEHRADDLMQTSCGSPCYAAPELVISDGLYVGSAVDIWSCGVILYAMLAGYLPFDDDPANPDGDNINLLYRYIVNTPLSFPDYISAEARDILGIMLVPDPTRRASLDAVMAHPWLAAYQQELTVPPGTLQAFGKTVDDLEHAAMEQHQQRRLAYQKQMRAANRANQPPTQDTSRSARSQSHRPEATTSSSGKREYLYETSAEHSYAANVSPQTAALAAAAAVTGGKKGSTPLVDDDDPFAPPGGATMNLAPPPTLNVPPPLTAPVTSSVSPKSGRTPEAQAAEDAKKHKATGSGSAFRHTIQVEYNSPAEGRGGSGRRESEDRSKRDRSGSQGQAPPAVPSQPNGANSTTSSSAKRTSHIPIPTTQKPLPPGPSPPTVPRDKLPAQAPNSIPTSAQPNSIPDQGQSKPTPLSPRPNAATATPTKPPPAITPPDVQINVNPPETPTQLSSPDPERGSQSSASAKGHRKGRSSIDRIGLGKIFGNSSSNSNNVINGGDTSLVVADRAPSDGNGSGANSATSSMLSPTGEKEKEKDKKEKEGRKSRRNTLTVVVGPITRSVRGKGKERKTSTPLPEMNGKDKVPHSAIPAVPNPALNGSVSSVVAPTATFATVSRTDVGGVGMQASTSKARKVMEWFRTKSKTRESVGIGMPDFEEVHPPSMAIPPQPPLPAEVIQQPQILHGRSATTHGAPTAVVASPQVVITTPPTPGAPATPSRSAPGHPQRSASTATDHSATTPSLVTRFRNSVTAASSSYSSTKNQTPGGALRIHHGAVDTTTVTTGQPPEVMKHVREVLENMGMEIHVESEYKYRCIRHKKRKGAMSSVTATGQGAMGSVGPGSSANGGGLAAITMVGSAASNGVDKRGLPLPSPSSFSSGGMLRGLLMRRQSSQVSNNSSTPAGPGPVEDESVVMSSEPLSMVEPAYGDPQQDAGDEVRFSVELTRIDRLNDTYSLDIRRLKGNLRSYKFLYDTLRQRADLQR
ncbi:Pkinase-domain-containing protein [Pluteus cervinus]|uniref:Pkinase-domain-containing protein n=1 Tax=Pluteus cervinus TaxID=181527 RepID=A0ACD3ATY0_9AGAR|nr:Pkinase-domain-containing protein [Pluteus cervinus]